MSCFPQVVKSKFFGRISSYEGCTHCKGSKNIPDNFYVGDFFEVPVEMYERMSFKQWRRFGPSLLLPENKFTCCPRYTIRLDVTKFKESKDHQRVRRRFDYFLKTGEKRRDESRKLNRKKKRKERKAKRIVKSVLPEVDKTITSILERMDIDNENLIPCKIKDLDSFSVTTSWKRMKKGELTTKSILKLYWIVFRKIGVKFDLDEITSKVASECEKLLNKNDFKTIRAQKNGEIFITLQDQSKISISEKKRKEETTQIINSKPDEIVTEICDPIFIEEEFLMASKGQEVIHDVKNFNRKKYLDFAVSSCLFPVRDEGNIPFGKYGTYHLKFRFKKSEKLIGFIVIDILPTGVSNVLYWYDLSFREMGIGKYMQLRLIDMILEENKKFPSFRYYYLGFYVFGAPKMSYKTYFTPSELLCNVEWKFVDVRVAKKVLERKNFGRFSRTIEDAELYEKRKKKKKMENDLMVSYNGKVLLKKEFEKEFGVVGYADSALDRMKNFFKSLDDEFVKFCAFILEENEIKTK